MRAVALHEFGVPDVLKVVERDLPEPGPGEVRIRVAAAAVNPTDLLLRSGQLAAYVSNFPAPYTPGMDASGTVDAVGEGVGLKPGAHVMSFVNPFRAEGGAQAEYVVVPQEQVAAIPESLDLQQAAGLPMNGLTADLAVEVLNLPSGATVGITGGAGALGGYAIQLAKQRGLRVVADALGQDRELLQRLGADVIVPRGAGTAQTFRAAVPEGVDGLIDAAVIGQEVLGAIKDGGSLVKCRPYELPAERDITMHRIVVMEHPSKQSALERLATLTATGAITLRTAAVFDPEEAAQAHRRLESGGVRGRLLIRF